MTSRRLPFQSGSVALVGSADSLRFSGNGPAIDAHDHVIRINQGAFANLDSANTGLRTDWVFLTLTGGSTSERLGFLRRARRAARVGIVLMSPLRRRLARMDLGWFLPHYPDQWFLELEQRLGSRPSSGAMALDFLLRRMDDPTLLDCYGFDFFATPDIAHGRNNTPAHSPDAEKAYFFEVLAPHQFHSPTPPTTGRGT